MRATRLIQRHRNAEVPLRHDCRDASQLRPPICSQPDYVVREGSAVLVLLKHDRRRSRPAFGGDPLQRYKPIAVFPPFGCEVYVRDIAPDCIRRMIEHDDL